MAEQQCPVCKRYTYLNPSMRILVSPCFHSLCEQCVYEMFSRGYAPCPACQTPLRRANFITSTFEDIDVECEMRVRKMLHKHFMREQDEFSHSEEYDDYLEEFENLVFSMLDCKNETEIRQRIAEIKTIESPLNPQLSKKIVPRHHEEEPVKRPKTEITRWGVYEAAPQKGLQLTTVHAIPPRVFSPCPPSGVTPHLLNQFILNSLRVD